MDGNMAMEVKIIAYQAIDKVVSPGSNTSGRVYLPKEWIGKPVKIFLMEELNEPTQNKA